jgi:diaminopimelate epimerase
MPRWRGARRPHRGVGFDQLAEIAPGQNADARWCSGTRRLRSAACGNATRCVARF